MAYSFREIKDDAPDDKSLEPGQKTPSISPIGQIHDITPASKGYISLVNPFIKERLIIDEDNKIVKSSFNLTGYMKNRLPHEVIGSPDMVLNKKNLKSGSIESRRLLDRFGGSKTPKFEHELHSLLDSKSTITKLPDIASPIDNGGAFHSLRKKPEIGRAHV